jgi:hypothetical protein
VAVAFGVGAGAAGGFGPATDFWAGVGVAKTGVGVAAGKGDALGRPVTLA